MRFKKIDLYPDISKLESMDDTSVQISPIENSNLFSDVDDDFSDVDPNAIIRVSEETPVGPQEGSDTGVADMLLSAINGEIQTIRDYNSIIATLKQEMQKDASKSAYESYIEVINDINNEENVHVGQLQAILKQVSPNAASIGTGVTEGEKQVNNDPNKISTVCSIADVDDAM